MHVGTKVSQDQVKQRMGGGELEMLNKMFSRNFCNRNEKSERQLDFFVLTCFLVFSSKMGTITKMFVL